MSYLVLARKWRPRNFAELAGQQHVLRALVNALNSGRIHHAFLFTGTRGVGKTTIARILAKSLNCERGVTAEPCGQCSACTEIDAGRFVDLIEVDAASRTKVDDTRELLDNVQYAPSRGRYKVYLIDEVHMLSTHSFNALLKTLEEPPPHVKFLLATTDPQKLPVTVLSRCLQFNLKRLSISLIIKRLTEIVEAEKIEYEAEALQLVAKAAAGSMRDALSLLDQIIAFGGSKIGTVDTRTMLGTIERTHIIELLDGLATKDAKRVLACVTQLDERAPDYHGVLAELATTLQRLALYQMVPDLRLEDTDDAEALQRLATAFSAEDLQLNYQIALVGRRDLDMAPDARGGFEMILLRMLAFAPARDGTTDNVSAAGRARSVVTSTATARKESIPINSSDNLVSSVPITTTPMTSITAPVVSDEWMQIVAQLNLQGPVSQLAANCNLLGKEGGRVKLLLDSSGDPFRRPALEERLTQALAAYYGEAIKLEFIAGESVSGSSNQVLDTPARRLQAQTEDKLRAARVAIENDPNVQAMRDIFGAVVHPESIKPIS